jgi:hypothetical protein
VVLCKGSKINRDKQRTKEQGKAPEYIIQDIVNEQNGRRGRFSKNKSGRVGPSPWYGFRSERGGLKLNVLRVHLNDIYELIKRLECWGGVMDPGRTGPKMTLNEKNPER